MKHLLIVVTLLLGAAALGAAPAETAATLNQEYEALQKQYEEKLPTIKSRDAFQELMKARTADLEALLQKHAADPASDELELTRGKILADLDRLPEAMAKVDALIAAKSPLHDAAALLKVGLLLMSDKTAEALTLFKSIEERLPKNNELYELWMLFAMSADNPADRKAYGQKYLALPDAPGKDRVTSALQQIEMLGQPAPAIAAENWFNGDPLTLETLKGKVVLIDFWATWCPPCRAVIPHLVKTYNELKDQGLVIIGFTKLYGNYRDERENKGPVPPEQERALIQEFLGRFQITYPIAVSDKGEEFKKYGISGIPTLVVIDKQGRIADIKVGSGSEEALVAQVKKLLAAD